MANDNLDTSQALTQGVVNQILKGKNIEQIAGILKITPEDVLEVWTDYKTNRKAMSWEDQWLIHLMRLENLLTLAHDVVEAEMDADSITALLKVLQQIEELQSLNLSRREKAEAEAIAMTGQQVQLLFQVFSEMQASMKSWVSEALEQKTYAKAKTILSGEFETVFSEKQKEAIEVVNSK